MRAAFVAVAVTVSLLAGGVVALATRREQAPDRRSQYLLTPLDAVALGHRRALDYLAADPSRSALLAAASRATASVVRVECRRETGHATTTSRCSGVVVHPRRVLTARHLLLPGPEHFDCNVL